jgi:hypothetical protein
MRTVQPDSTSSEPSAHDVVERPTPPFGCTTANVTGAALRRAERVGAATVGSTVIVTRSLLLTLRSGRGARDSHAYHEPVPLPSRRCAPARTAASPGRSTSSCRSAGTPYVYGRCRECRNKRARERYHSTTEIHTAEVARSWRNKQARKLRVPSGGRGCGRRLASCYGVSARYLLLGLKLNHRLATIVALQRVPELFERLQPTFGPL